MIWEAWFARVLVYGGACILIVALNPIKNLLQRLQHGRIRFSWMILMFLTLLFVVGYVGYGVAFLESRHESIDLIVPGIFFFGAIFVLLSSLLSLRTVIDVRRVTMLEQENVTDALTGIFNRRYLDRRLYEEFARAERYQQPLSIILIDFDNFKIINDEYGHVAGDSALTAFVKIIMDAIRASDVIARYGGDEFLVIATNTINSEAYQLAERIRKLVETQTLDMIDENKRHFSVRLTASIGVSCYCEKFQSVQSFVESADQMMYQAKKEGRNRVMLWQDCVYTKKAPMINETSFNL